MLWVVIKTKYMLYIINCEIVENYYMGETIKNETNHIIEAETEEEARDKLERYYEMKNNEFYVTYYVNVNYCNEVIK